MKNWEGFIAIVVGEIKSYVAEKVNPIEQRLGMLETKAQRGASGGESLFDIVAEQDARITELEKRLESAARRS